VTLRLWLLGSSVARSPSPAMQNAALRALGVAGGYEAMDVDERGFDAAVALLRSGAAQGANVTIPHKRRAAQACDALEGDADLLGAVNTLVVEEGRLIGANTDALGLEAALRSGGFWPAGGGERAPGVVLGAGGAAAAAVLVLLRAGVEHVVLAARNPQAAMAAATDLAARVAGVVDDAAIVGMPLSRVPALLPDAAWIVNATPAGLDELPVDVALAARTAIVVDLRYRPRPVDLVAAATAAGLRACDGLEMLLAQGMLSLRRWTGQEPPWEAARSALLTAVAA
jgi:shikimate dehydrogenase